MAARVAGVDKPSRKAGSICQQMQPERRVPQDTHAQSGCTVTVDVLHYSSGS
jgi:hypothetical protein